MVSINIQSDISDLLPWYLDYSINEHPLLLKFQMINRDDFLLQKMSKNSHLFYFILKIQLQIIHQQFKNEKNYLIIVLFAANAAAQQSPEEFPPICRFG